MSTSTKDISSSSSSSSQKPSSPAPSGTASSSSEATEEEYLTIISQEGYESAPLKYLLFCILCICSGFILFLLALWFPHKFISWRYRRVPLVAATYVYVLGKVHGGELRPVFLMGEDDEEEHEKKQGRHLKKQQTAASKKQESLQAPLLHASASSSSSSSSSSSEEHTALPPRRMFVFRHMRYIYSSLTEQYEMVSSEKVPAAEAQAPLRSGASWILPSFARVCGLSSGECDDRLMHGLNTQQVEFNQALHGSNALLLKVPSIPSLLFTEVFHPFYVFQMYSVILWCFEAYFVFATAIAIMAIVSIVTTLIETRKRMRDLAELAKFDCIVQVKRNGVFVPISSTNLVPGDIVEVETGIVPCDLALLEGGAVVNESMLTGESVPVVKTNVQWPAQRDSQAHTLPVGQDSRCTLFSATKILQLKPNSNSPLKDNKVYGMVIRTGFATTKGSLILSILFPKPSAFRFEAQSFKFIGALFMVALVGFGISVWQLSEDGADTSTIVIRAFDLITIVVPPSLPLALSVGVNFALLWLQRSSIFCISPNRITMAGKVRLMCFDKTGTLTAESLEFMGVLPSYAGLFYTFQSPATTRQHTLQVTEARKQKRSSTAQKNLSLNDQDQNGYTSLDGDVADDDDAGEEEHGVVTSASFKTADILDTAHPVPLTLDVKISMACCQALAQLDGALVGDPLEVQTFQASHATMQDSGDHLGAFKQIVQIPSSPLSTAIVQKFGVLEQFEFSSSLQRMSVLVQDISEEDQQEHKEAKSKNHLMSTNNSAAASSSSSSHAPSDAHPLSQSTTGTYHAIVKGSPEMIFTLCQKQTLPSNFTSVLAHFAHQGYRIIAIASKVITPPTDTPEAQLNSAAALDSTRHAFSSVDKDILRTQVESDLIFQGLILLENKLKVETAPTLEILHKAGIRSVMVTGDNPLTAVTVAKDCGLVDRQTKIFQSNLKERRNPVTGQTEKYIAWIDVDDETETVQLDPDTLKLPSSITSLPSFRTNKIGQKYELAVTGPCYKFLYDKYVVHAATPTADTFFHRVILASIVFARMTPDQKASLVSSFQSLDLYTGMCGDGANDCASLKTAHVGVSLSESEASIAAPFTYTKPNISCIPILLSEGRSSLITSFQLFRYMAMYSMIQFGAVILTYFKGSVLGDWQYLYQDLWTVFPLTVFMGATRARKELTFKRPSGNLFSITNLFNLFTHVGITMSFQVAIFEITQHFEGYVDLPNPNTTAYSYVTTVLYYFSNFQYAILALLFSRGHPWKKPFYTNWKFSVWLLINVSSNLALLFSHDQPGFFRKDDLPIPTHWRKVIFIWICIHFATSVIFDLFISPAVIKLYKTARDKETATSKKGTVFGRRKLITGHNIKTFHALRGEFEQGWRFQPEGSK